MKLTKRVKAVTWYPGLARSEEVEEVKGQPKIPHTIPKKVISKGVQ
ncbi:predicted protein [Plenodomus lingam JN3]|uniref:Predicted protein n=1 Tax=Leptosphaeria maculans (strain JN3 / isolate v23.1.3 / race Av1-4-5-6-7-8) TaxID=985895 RepID=E4ZN21_LEPMJ|nr:predicted protein [Plenodomus lingam JN3]CBX92624.1 predicted protein [Plenodomus lingam JN3]